ncbi:hypothetical protein AX17_006757 [Amanita inopinata Kibby_2008]|nr:hypothetical protein AX17_006757 [Amanita inopinata Kibby_2008]
MLLITSQEDWPICSPAISQSYLQDMLLVSEPPGVEYWTRSKEIEATNSLSSATFRDSRGAQIAPESWNGNMVISMWDATQYQARSQRLLRLSLRPSHSVCRRRHGLVSAANQSLPSQTIPDGSPYESEFDRCGKHDQIINVCIWRTKLFGPRYFRVSFGPIGHDDGNILSLMPFTIRETGGLALAAGQNKCLLPSSKPGSIDLTCLTDGTLTSLLHEKLLWGDVLSILSFGPRRVIEDVKELLQQFDDASEDVSDDYIDEIEDYRAELEQRCLPMLDMMVAQTISSIQRQASIDWLQWVCARQGYGLGTIWTAVNLLDRFLHKHAVTEGKLHLLVTVALLISVKFHEVAKPDLRYYIESSREDIDISQAIQGERMVLKVLDYEVFSGCSPWHWLPIEETSSACADLEDFLVQVTMLDQRFSIMKPSLVAAIVSYTIGQMAITNDALVRQRRRWSGYDEKTVRDGHGMLLEKLREDEIRTLLLYKTYSTEGRVSRIAVEWANR